MPHGQPIAEALEVRRFLVLGGDWRLKNMLELRPHHVRVGNMTDSEGGRFCRDNEAGLSLL